MATVNRTNPSRDDAAPLGAAVDKSEQSDSLRPLDVGQTFLAALSRRDYDELERYFEPDARFRALVPSGLKEGSGPQEAVGWLRRWFGDADVFDVQRTELDWVCDRLHISYRLRVREEGLWYLVEQQAYCVVGDEKLKIMSLLCSGFRPESASASS
jgi:hypothetical protein